MLRKTDDRLAPLQTRTNSCVLRERRVFAEGAEVGPGQHFKPVQESRWVTAALMSLCAKV